MPWEVVAAAAARTAVANGMDLAGAVAKNTSVAWLGKVLADRDLDDPMRVLLLGLAETRDDELARLAELDRKLQLLLDAPFAAGLSELEAAAAGHRTAERRRELVESARVRFTDAHAQASDPTRAALAAFYLAQCWLMHGEWIDATRWLVRAHDRLAEHMADADSAHREWHNNWLYDPPFFEWPWRKRPSEEEVEDRSARFDAVWRCSGSS